MGKRDYRHREPKKSKKDKETPASPIIPSPVNVEVVKKRKKPSEEE